jgi:nucleoside-diphosphate-sugar epimerase
MMNVFVTGGSGFVGSYLIPYLIERGYEVVALARSQSALAKVETFGAKGLLGDIHDVASLTAAMQGCDVVVHMAAALEMWGDEQMFYEMNVRGTENALRAAQTNGVKRFIYMSAASVVGGGIAAEMVDEGYRLPHLPDDFYSKTKLIAEDRVIAANSPQMVTMALRPPLIWGKGHSMTEGIRAAVAEGRFMWIGGGQHKLSTIHVENLCAATAAAIEQGCAGEIYFVTDGETRPVKHFLTDWLRAEGIEAGERSVPRPAALFFARVMETLWRLFRLQSAPPITNTMIYMLGTELWVKDDKARQHLGYQNMVSIDEGLRRLQADR